MKRIITLLIIVLFLFAIPLFANAAVVDSGECGTGVTWTLDDSGLLTISGTGKMTSAPWRNTSTEIRKVIIENGITNIYEYAFFGRTQLTDVSIPESVTAIENDALRGCSGLTEITIPDSVTTIENYAFYQCTGLTSITVPENVTDIGSVVFAHCTGLKSATIKARTNKIYFHSIFEDCTSLAEVSIPSDHRGYKVENGIIYNKDGTHLVFCPPAKKDDFTISDGVEQIDWFAFRDCAAMKSISIPASVRSIDQHAFTNCSLPEVTLSANVTFLGNDAFDKTVRLRVPKDSYAAKWAYENYYDYEEYEEGPATIKLSKSKLTIKGTKPGIVTAELSDPNDTIATVNSSDTKVAKAKCSGNEITITPNKKAGKATITVTTEMGAEAKLTVTVKEFCELNAKSIILKKGDKFKIKLSAVPTSIKIKNCESSKPKVAKVDKKGNINAKKKGKATIIVTLSNGEELKLKVTVK